MHGNLFHTLLSILGMIIGVAALVSILSLIDGMEQYAKDQISQTTSLKSIVISPRNTKTVNGISVKKDSFVYITYPKFRALRNAVTKPAQAYLISTQSAEVVAANQKIVSMVYGCSEKIKPSFTTQKGRIFSIDDFENNSGSAVINVAFAKAAKEKQNWLNEKLRIHQREVNVIGIIDDKSDRPEVYLPLTAFTDVELKACPPSVAFDVENIEDVASVKETIRGWMKREHPNNLDDMELMTHEFRLEQATQGFMLFRVIMGLIVGISVIVWGHWCDERDVDFCYAAHYRNWGAQSARCESKRHSIAISSRGCVHQYVGQCMWTDTWYFGHDGHYPYCEGHY